jgi:hypothetical protein
MASKASKRVNSAQAAPVAKKAKQSPNTEMKTSPKKASTKKMVGATLKVESVFADIVLALGNAEHLPEQCREMLVAMVEPSLRSPQAERHAAQKLAVSMIEETLQAIKTSKVVVVEQAGEELSKLEESQKNCLAKVSEIHADLTSKEAIRQSKVSVLDQATNLVKEAETTLAETKETKRKGEAPLVELESEKASLEKISKEHVKAPLDANEGPHFLALEPHIHTLGLDASLAIALPSSCAKTKEQRGHFDDVVLGELEKALFSKIESLTKSIAEEAPKLAEREAAVTSADSTLGEKVAAEKAAALDLETADRACLESSGALSKANEELEILAPSLQVATSKLEELKIDLNKFELGPLANFESYQSKTVSSEEAAFAGA